MRITDLMLTIMFMVLVYRYYKSREQLLRYKRAEFKVLDIIFYYMGYSQLYFTRNVTFFQIVSDILCRREL